jgi:hypothetical protein
MNHRKKSFKTIQLNGKRVQRIPFWLGVLSNRGKYIRADQPVTPFFACSEVWRTIHPGARLPALIRRAQFPPDFRSIYDGRRDEALNCIRSGIVGLSNAKDAFWIGRIFDQSFFKSPETPVSSVSAWAALRPF